MTEHAHHGHPHESAPTTARGVPVGALRPGDHACLDVPDAQAHWQVLTAYTRAGLTRGEKVMVVLDPADVGDDDALARLDAGTGQAEAARRSGQLEIVRNTAVYVPDGRFSRERQFRLYSAELERTRAEGRTGLRVGADMAWGKRAGVSDAQLLDYEAFMEPLFVDPRLTAMCWYSRHQYADHLVAAMRTVHPLQVMTHLDALEVTRTDDASPLRYSLDLTDLCYMEAHTAWQLVRFARDLPDGDTLDVRCGPILEAVFRGLGSDDVRQLRLRTETEGA
ncbi:MEDS domain-containing protein [Streptomyces sp. ME02-8801-2C]|uniref:MEDS domain-containing protein n=1 Tax=Streptomyces sp. ME02-8801-2C TaxID=3028680 RepID=UPI0029B4CF1A|nr:MEDS domain-containing protein [Streptomyces sp. ME02-8801-2C]MDX3453237.1 MEDS domain-containing protein [Streptomyces sp. ME02-8801-2C]